jgi:hypothetical protein
MKLVLASLSLCSFVFCQSVAIQDLNDPKRGRLKGSVEDEFGRPLAGAKVTASPPGALAAILPNTETDAEGHFALAGLLPGQTYVQASKEKDFYPDAQWNFWDRQGAAEVKVLVGAEISGISLRVRPCARLEINAVDASTGDAIQDFTVRLERDGAPDRSVSGTTWNNLWLVPTTPIRVMVSANGYRSAWYGEDGPARQVVSIMLAPRQNFSITVRLRRTDKI